jgi:hypothetical protein
MIVSLTSSYRCAVGLMTKPGGGFGQQAQGCAGIGLIALSARASRRR